MPDKTTVLKSVQKFIAFLKTVTSPEVIKKMINKREENESDIKNVADYLIVCNHFIRIYSCSMEDWEKINEICNDFAILSRILKHTEFSDKEISDIVFYLIRKNIGSGLLNKTTIILKQEDLKKFPFHDVSVQEMFEFITTDARFLAMQKKEEMRSEKERVLLREFERWSKNSNYDLYDIISPHQTIQTYYFDKERTFTFEDIALVLEALKKLKVSEFVLGSVNKTLKKELRQRNSGIYAIASEDSSTHEEKRSTHKKESATPKESEEEKQKRERQRKEREAALLVENKKRKDEKAIYKLMSDIYDIESKEFLVIPTDTVIFNWVSYATSVQLPLPTILQFLREAYRQISTMDPVVQYGILYKKLKYYEEVAGISNELKELEQYLDALLEASVLVNEKKEQAIEDSGAHKQGEEISFWEEELRNKLKLTLELVPKDYEYELKH